MKYHLLTAILICALFVLSAVSPICSTAESAILGQSGSVTGNQASDNFGWNVSAAGDVNGDGTKDIIVGAPGNTTNRGSAYLFFGSTSAIGNINAKNANVAIAGGAASDRFGWSVSGAGDMNKDGYDDIIIGAPGAGNKGSAYIFFGRPIWLSTLTASNANVTITGTQTGDLFGTSVSRLGDVDKDGYDDAIIGAPGNRSSQGAAYAFFGNNTFKASYTALGANATMYGKWAGDKFGTSVSGAGDMNGDGYSDILVGAPGNASNKGRAYLYHGRADLGAWTQNGTYLHYDQSTGAVVSGAYGLFDTQMLGQSFWCWDSYKINKISVLLRTEGTATGAVSFSIQGDNNWPDGNKLATTESRTGVYSALTWFTLNFTTPLVLKPMTKYWIVGESTGTTSTKCWDWAQDESTTTDFRFANAATDVYSGGKWEWKHDRYTTDGIFRLLSDIPVGIQPDRVFIGGKAGDLFGHSVSDAGNVNGDGYGDVIIGAPGTANGTAYLMFGGKRTTNVSVAGEPGDEMLVEGFEEDWDIDAAVYAIYNASTSDMQSLGFSFTPNNTFTLTRASLYLRTIGTPGTLTVKLQGSTGTLSNNVTLAQAPSLSSGGTTTFKWHNFTWTKSYNCTSTAEYFVIAEGTGASTANCWGWYTDDDISDGGQYPYCDSAFFRFSSTWAVSATDRYLRVYGRPTTTVPNVTFAGAAAGDRFGQSVSSAGGFNSDALSDIIIGAPSAGGKGAVYIFNGSAAMPAKWGAAAANFTGSGENSGDRFGWSVSDAGDLCTGVGKGEALAGAPYFDPSAASDAGKAYVFSDLASSDVVKPAISNVKAQPATQEAGGKVNISCTATDASGISQVFVNITLPGGGNSNVSMTGGAGNSWFLNSTYSTVGAYTYKIYVRDNSGNWNSTVGSFAIVTGPLYRITLAKTAVTTYAGAGGINLNTSTQGYNRYNVLNTTWKQQWAENGTGNCAVSSAGVLTPGTKAETYWVWCNDTRLSVSNHTKVTVTPATLSRITLAYAQVTASVAGSPLNLNTSTKGYDQYGNLNSTWSQKWATNASSCSISQAGVLTLGTKAETFWVWCNNSQQTVSNHTIVNLRPGAVSRIVMAYTDVYCTAGGPSVNVNSTTKGYDGYGNLNTTWGRTWTTDCPGGSVSAAGVFTPGTTAGTFKVTCTATAAPISNLTMVHILPAKLHEIRMTYAEVNAQAGGASIDLNSSTHGYDVYGNLNDSFFWKWSTNATGGFVDTLGAFFPGTKAGTFAVWCNNSDNSVSNKTVVYILPANLHHISVSPSNDLTITTDDEQAFNCHAYDVYGNSRGPVAVNWSLTASIGTVVAGPGASTTLTPQNTGVTKVRATMGGMTAYSGNITITPGALASIRITPYSPGTVTTDDILDFLAEGYDAKGNLRGYEVVNWTVVGNIGRIDNVTAKGTALTFTTPGTGMLQARIGGIMNTTATIKVLVGSLKEIRITPSAVGQMTADEQKTFVSMGYDRWGNLIGAVNTSWSVTGGIGTIPAGPSTSGLFDATMVGTGHITAASGGVSNSTLDFSVIAGALFDLDISPKLADVTVGQTKEFTLSPQDEDGNAVSVSGTVWTTDCGLITDSNAAWAEFQAQATVVSGGYVKAQVGAMSALAGVNVVSSSGKPEINGRVPDQVRFEDSIAWNLDLKPYEPASAPSEWQLRWYLEDVNSSLVTVGGELSEDRVLTFVPVPNAFGSNKATLWLTNKDGLKAAQALWINLTPVNDPPAISQPPDLVVRYDKPFLFDYSSYVSDIDNDLSALILTATESGGSSGHVAVSGLSATYTYPESAKGTVVIVTLRLSDGVDSSQAAIDITVSDDYAPEISAPLPDITMYEGETKKDVFKLTDHFADPDKELIYFTSKTQHLTVTINTDTAVDLAALTQWTGDELVTFRAQDPKGALTEDTIIVHILPLDNPPTISGVPDLVVHYDAPYRFDLTPYVTDVDTPLEQLFVVVEDVHMNISEDNNLAIVLTYPKALVGKKVPLALRVTDGTSIGSQDIYVTVSDNWPPESKAKIPDVTIYEDQSLLGHQKGGLNLKDYFLDRDNNEIYFSYGQKQIAVTIHNNGSVDFIPKPNWNGIEYITFRATDSGGALVEDTVKVTVISVNDPPVLDVLPDQTGSTGLMWKLDIRPFLSDIDTNTTLLKIYTESEDLPGLEVIVAGSELVFFSTQAGVGTLRVYVSDGENTVERSVNVTVTKSEVPQGTSDAWMYILILIAIVIIVLLVLLVVAKRAYFGAYTIEEAFIVDKHGMCLAHRSRRGGEKVDSDEDIFTGMLTVVQQFVKDSFKQKKSKAGQEEYLNMFKFGDTTVLIEPGKLVFVAVFFRGSPGKRLEARLKKFITDLEFRHASSIKGWGGNTKSIAALSDELVKLVGK